VALEEGARLDLVSTTDRTGGRGEDRVPAYRFGIVLLLLLATFVFLASGPTGNWVALVAVLLQGATLLAALYASGASRHLLRFAVVVVLIGLVAGLVALFVGVHDVTGPLFLLNLLLLGAAPVAIVRSLVRRRVIDIHTVLGALCVYVLLAMLWAFAFAAVGSIGSQPFFAQQRHATVADFVYFSFVTIATVGYGDLTAAGGLGRALAALEGLTGQLYLVTVIALLVANLVPRRPRHEEQEEPTPPSRAA
jgi:hypothetical protein